MQSTSNPRASQSTCAKIANSKDIIKIYDYFRYKTATTLDAALNTGILRNSITWYVKMLEDMGVLKAVFSAPDRHTGRVAKHYSSNPDEWKRLLKPKAIQLELSGKEVYYE